MRPLLLAALLPFAGCTLQALPGPGAGPTGGDDTSAQPDGGAVAAACAVPDSLGTAPMTNLQAQQTNQAGSQGARHDFALNGQFDSAATPDVFDLELHDNTGIFTGAVAPGTYQITGGETSVQTCGLCVAVLGDLDQVNGPKQIYFAQSGTVELDTITPTLAGTVTNVTLQEIDPNTGALVSGGCSTLIASMPFSSTVQVITSGGGGGGGGGG